MSKKFRPAEEPSVTLDVGVQLHDLNAQYQAYCAERTYPSLPGFLEAVKLPGPGFFTLSGDLIVVVPWADGPPDVLPTRGEPTNHPNPGQTSKFHITDTWREIPRHGAIWRNPHREVRVIEQVRDVYASHWITYLSQSLDVVTQTVRTEEVHGIYSSLAGYLPGGELPEGVIMDAALCAVKEWFARAALRASN